MHRTILIAGLALCAAPARAGLPPNFGYTGISPFQKSGGSSGGGGGNNSGGGGGGGGVDRSTEPARPGGWIRNQPDTAARFNQTGYQSMKKGTELFRSGSFARAISYFEDALAAYENASRYLSSADQEKHVGEARLALAVAESAQSNLMHKKGHLDEALRLAKDAFARVADPGLAANVAELEREWCALHVPLKPQATMDNQFGIVDRATADYNRKLELGRANACEWAK